MKDVTDTNDSQKVTAVSASILDDFELLRNQQDDFKLTGGAKILSSLNGNENEKNLQYVLKRLVRSLGANVPEARTGYFATLVGLLSKFEQITAQQLFELIKKELHASGSSKSEVGDVALGQILVCGAVLRSGLMLRCSEDDQKEVINLLLTASKKKSYLGTVTYLILLDFVNELNEEQFSSIVWSHIKADFKKELKEQSLDSLYFLMVASNKFPAKVKLKKLIGSPEILNEDNIQDVSDKLMGGIDFNTANHPIFKEIGAHIANSEHLLQFWTTGIDTHLLKHNRNRELVAINILTAILNNITENYEVIPELLSRNFFKLFMDWFKGLQTASKIRNKRDNEDDHKIMIKKEKELLNALAKALKSEQVNNKIRIEILKKLLFNPGEMNFTEITGTNIVKLIIADLDKDGVKKMAKYFKGVLLNTSKKVIKEEVERNWYNNERVRAAEMISYLVGHETMKDDIEFRLTYMKILMCFGFFKIGGDENVPISSELSGSIKACFYRCFTSHFTKVDNLVTVLSSLCSFICAILKKAEVRTKMEKQFPEENMECWNMLIGVTQSIEQIDSKSKVDKVFLILLYQLGLFLFSDPTYVKLARSSIKELKSCYEHYRNSKKKKTKRENDLADEPEWIEVLIEVLLSILSAESSVLRAVVQCVFRLLWENLTPSSIGQIVSVLDPENEDNPLTNDSESENEDDKPIDEQSDQDVENGEEKSDDESDSEVEDEQDDEEMRTPEQLRMAVQKALGSVANESDGESVDADMIDEEEGKKLDEALAEAFKQFHTGKGKKSKKDRKDKKALSDFRVRALDLIDIYLEKDPSMDICLGMVAPLTRCLEFCLSDPQLTELGNRVRKTIKFLAKIRKFSTMEDVTIDILCDYLKSTIDKGSRSHFMYQALGDVITYLATFIIQCSQKIEVAKPKSLKKLKNVSSPLTEILKEALQNYFQQRNCLLPIIFFHNILQLEWDGNYKLARVIVENIFHKDVRQFRRSEGLELFTGFYRFLKRCKPTSEKLLNRLSVIETEFETLLRETLQKEDFVVKNNFFMVLKKLLKTMKDFHTSCNVKSSIDFKVLSEFVSANKGAIKIKGNMKNKSNENQVQQALSQKKNNRKNKIKRKAGHMNGNAEPPHKKHKQSKDT